MRESRVLQYSVLQYIKVRHDARAIFEVSVLLIWNVNVALPFSLTRRVILRQKWYNETPRAETSLTKSTVKSSSGALLLLVVVVVAHRGSVVGMVGIRRMVRHSGRWWCSRRHHRKKMMMTLGIRVPTSLTGCYVCWWRHGRVATVVCSKRRALLKLLCKTVVSCASTRGGSSSSRSCCRRSTRWSHLTIHANCRRQLVRMVVARSTCTGTCTGSGFVEPLTSLFCCCCRNRKGENRHVDTKERDNHW